MGMAKSLSSFKTPSSLLCTLVSWYFKFHINCSILCGGIVDCRTRDAAVRRTPASSAWPVNHAGGLSRFPPRDTGMLWSASGGASFIHNRNWHRAFNRIRNRIKLHVKIINSESTAYPFRGKQHDLLVQYCE
jgi:hypothetical protein